MKKKSRTKNSKKSWLKGNIKLSVLAVLVLLIMALGIVLVRTSSATIIPAPATALLYGDSIMFESSNQISSQFASKPGWSFKNTSYPGSALCDWSSQLQTDLDTLHPQIVVLESQGNSITPCMRDAAGNQIPFGSQAWLDKYKSDLDYFFATATASGAKVLWVAPLPVSSPSSTKALQSLNQMAKTEAGKYHGISVSGAPKNSVTTDGLFVWRKGCLPTESAAMGCGAVVAGKIAVRSPDGVHLCPNNPEWLSTSPCNVYSSGEFRWGNTLVDKAVNPPTPLLP